MASYEVTPEFNQIGPYQRWTEEGQDKFRDGRVCRHGSPPDFSQQSLAKQSKISTTTRKPQNSCVKSKQMGCDLVSDLDSIMCKERLGVCLRSQIQHRGFAPAGGFPHQQGIGSVFTVGVALTEQIWSQCSQKDTHMHLSFCNCSYENYYGLHGQLKNKFKGRKVPQINKKYSSFDHHNWQLTKKIHQLIYSSFRNSDRH